MNASRQLAFAGGATIAPIFTNREGLFLQTIYHPLRLYAEHMREIALDVHVAGETRELPAALETPAAGRVHHVSDLGPFSLLDAAGTSDLDGRRIALAVINRDHERDIDAAIDLGGATVGGVVEITEVNGAAVSAVNSFETPRAVDCHERRVDASGSRLTHRFPAHSVSVLRFEVRLT